MLSSSLQNLMVRQSGVLGGVPLLAKPVTVLSKPQRAAIVPKAASSSDAQLDPIEKCVRNTDYTVQGLIGIDVAPAYII